jgi:hypothetical protein
MSKPHTVFAAIFIAPFGTAKTASRFCSGDHLQAVVEKKDTWLTDYIIYGKQRQEKKQRSKHFRLLTIFALSNTRE